MKPVFYIFTQASKNEFRIRTDSRQYYPSLSHSKGNTVKTHRADVMIVMQNGMFMVIKDRSAHFLSKTGDVREIPALLTEINEFYLKTFQK